MYKTIFTTITILIILIIIVGCNPLIYIIGDGPDRPQLNKKEEENQIKEREKYIEEHPTLTDEQKTLISSGIVGEGLTKNQIINILNWAEPDRVLSTTMYGADEVWIYKLPRSLKVRKLYFKHDGLIKLE